ncbi:MAG TPA: hypothetical protein VKB14_02225 [Actinomycetales bacterium]|nr:hypothetical protein [Actinomycetales bacterium]
MSKIFRIAVASAVIGGVAALTPMSAQAKSVPEMVGAYEAASCAGAASAPGSVNGTSFSINLPAAGAVDVVARVYTVNADGTQNFSARKTVLEGVAGAVSGSVLQGQHIWRIDASDPATDALLYTSDGVLGCD